MRTIKRPFIQPLEPRRLMSLTAAFDSPPPAVPPPPPAANDLGALDAQFARAIAHGTPVVLTPETQNASPSPAGPTTISALYSTLGTSTVSAIDSANASGDWDTTAIVINATIAGILYAERELVRGKKNLGGIFSTKLLRAWKLSGEIHGGP